MNKVTIERWCKGVFDQDGKAYKDSFCVEASFKDAADLIIALASHVPTDNPLHRDVHQWIEDWHSPYDSIWSIDARGIWDIPEDKFDEQDPEPAS